MPALTERVRYLLRNLNPEESADYESVKAAVLVELKLSPAEYLQRFERAVKRKEETWAQFASRVKTYFSYYLQVREADTVEVMAELMVADRIKSGLSTEGLEYVRLRKGEGWLRPTEIAKVLQTFEKAKGKGRASKQPTVEMGQKPATRVEKGALKCHLCHGSGHFAKECQKASDKENNPKKATEPKRKVQKVTLSHETDTEIPTGVLSAKVKSLKHEGEGTDKLQLIPVSCAGISADTILDTGSEITVIRESPLPRSVVEPSGTTPLSRRNIKNAIEGDALTTVPWPVREMWLVGTSSSTMATLNSVPGNKMTLLATNQPPSGPDSEMKDLKMDTPSTPTAPTSTVLGSTQARVEDEKSKAPEKRKLPGSDADANPAKVPRAAEAIVPQDSKTCTSTSTQTSVEESTWKDATSELIKKFFEILATHLEGLGIEFGTIAKVVALSREVISKEQRVENEDSTSLTGALAAFMVTTAISILHRLREASWFHLLADAVKKVVQDAVSWASSKVLQYFA
ncbi:hypothetical protein MRX96_040337 [Rhipicephalus microplus]